MTRFWWCHTEQCPNYDRAREVNTGSSTYKAMCAYCATPMHLVPPGTPVEIPDNIVLGEE